MNNHMKIWGRRKAGHAGGGRYVHLNSDFNSVGGGRVQSLPRQIKVYGAEFL